MEPVQYDIEIISAPSILGLRSTGVDRLGKALLDAGLAEKLSATHPVVHVPTLNNRRSNTRDPETKCLNAGLIRDFSLTLEKVVAASINNKRFPFVLGGDCSILIGIMPALKAKGSYGIIFIDAHADFYEPERSTTGEVADMDLAIITGRGPDILTNINNLQPYVKDEHVIHIGQRDWEETQRFGSQDIRETIIPCFSLADIEKKGVQITATEVVQHMHRSTVEGFWIHFDTDVLSNDINPAVDYRLPGGLQFHQAEYLIKTCLLTGKIAGISVTIFNPALDKDKQIAGNIVAGINRMFM